MNPATLRIRFGLELLGIPAERQNSHFGKTQARRSATNLRSSSVRISHLREWRHQENVCRCYRKIHKLKADVLSLNSGKIIAK